MEEQLVKVVVTAGVVTGNREDGTVGDAVPGQCLLVRPQSLEGLKDRVKLWEAPVPAPSEPEATVILEYEPAEPKVEAKPEPKHKKK